jgi:hypothetical protein
MAKIEPKEITFDELEETTKKITALLAALQEEEANEVLYIRYRGRKIKVSGIKARQIVRIIEDE